jgi:Protein of unknown function (DUF2865)
LRVERQAAKLVLEQSIRLSSLRLRREDALFDRSTRASAPKGDASERSRRIPTYPRRNRTLTAFVTGAALAAAGWLVVHPIGQGAAARGPIANSAVEFLVPSSGSGFFATDPGSEAPTVRVKASAGGGLSSGRSVCVRLCDGFFFPIAPVSGRADWASSEATCQQTCPDAPTAVYIQPSGSDKIEDAVSTTGAPYTALPVALRSRTVLDNTCACHRTIAQGYSHSLLHDLTLRKGDTVMTPNGFLVFQGRSRPPFVREDFVALKQAPLSNDNRAALMAMEHASALSPAAGRTGARSAAAQPRTAKSTQ